MNKGLQDLQRYEQTAERLAACEYDVIPSPAGFLVSHRTDPNDVSRARDLDDLADLADLFEWRKHRQGAWQTR